MHFDAYASMHQNASVCIKMHQVHQNASNELCKCFVHKINKYEDFITFNLGKMHQYAVILVDERSEKYRSNLREQLLHRLSI